MEGVPDEHEFIERLQPLEEVNFWQPSGGVRSPNASQASFAVTMPTNRLPWVAEAAERQGPRSPGAVHFTERTSNTW